MINQYDMVVRQNRELQKELAIKNKMIELILDYMPPRFNEDKKFTIHSFEQIATEELNNANR